MVLRVKKRGIVMYCAFILLLFPYLQGSIGLLPGKFYPMMPVIAVVLFLILNLKKIKVYPKELLTWSCILFPCFFQNYDVKTGRYNIVLDFLSVFLIYIIAKKDQDWIKYFWNVIKIVCVIHFILGLFFLVNKNLLYSVVIPRFTMTENTYNLLNEAINNGYMTGICNHYSKMGMYMALGTIAFAYPIYDKEMESRKRKIALVMFFAFVIGLAMTGKRGPLLFTVLALLIVFLEYSEKRLTRKAIFRFFIGIFSLIILFAIAYFKIPQVQSVIARFSESSNMEEMTNGRIDFFWVQAIEMFKNHPIIGYGWGAFKAYSKNGNHAHNIYLQLLTETGIIGFFMVLIFFIGSILAIRKSINIMKGHDNQLCTYLKIGYAYQLFFLMYGFTGNPLYDGQCYLPYLLSCAMGLTVYFEYSYRLQKVKKNEKRINCNKNRQELWGVIASVCIEDRNRKERTES